MKKKINILFVAGAKRVSLAEKFIAAGEHLGYKVNIFSYELSLDVPIYFIAKEIILGKKWNDENIFYHLQQVIQVYNINIVLPFTDPATIILSKLKSNLDKKVFIPLSAIKTVEVFFDKILTNDWCKNNNIPVPSNEFTSFPLIAKPRFGSASKGIIKIGNVEDLDKINENEYLIQKYIEAIEYTVDCYISSRKKIISITPRIRLEVQGGESIKSLTVKDNFIINLSKAILNKTTLIGPVTIQFLKEKRTDKLYFMEINPRFGGAVLTSIGAGANIPLYLLKDYLSIKLKYNGNWDDNFLMIRRFCEYYKKK